MIEKWGIVALLLVSQSVLADQDQLEQDMLQLMSMEVDMTSAMKRAQPINSTPASIFVLEREDIRLSGYTTLPQLLKLIPGVDARRIDNTQWAVSVRSAASKFNSNLMVMIDGRNISEPVVNSIYWETLAYPAHDIERIELIRGAAGSLWGNSANNGILNIITRHTLDTQGTHLRLSVGDPNTYSLEARYGDSINDQVSYRLFGTSNKGRKSGDKIYRERYYSPATDDNDKYSFGAQMDYQYGEKNSLKFQYSYSDGQSGLLQRDIDPQTFDLSYTQRIGTFSSSNSSLRVEHNPTNNLKLFSQMTYSDFESITAASGSTYRSTTLSTALNYRWVGGVLSAGFDHDSNIGRLYSANGGLDLNAKNHGFFLQNEFNFFANSLKVLVGSRWDQFKVHGREVSPNIRFNYSYSDNHSIWGAYSSGNRMLINSDKDIQLLVGLPNEDMTGTYDVLRLTTSESIEHANTSEFGYRFNDDVISVALSLFNIDYESQFIGYDSIDISAGFPVRWIDVTNAGRGQSYGADMTIEWQVNKDFNTLVGISLLKHQLSGLDDNARAYSPDDFTNNQLFIRSRYDINDSVKTQFLYKYIGDNDAIGSQAYSILDLAIHWELNDYVMLSIVGQNLIDDNFVEFPNEASIFGSTTAVGRNLYFDATINF